MKNVCWFNISNVLKDKEKEETQNTTRICLDLMSPSRDRMANDTVCDRIIRTIKNKN